MKLVLILGTFNFKFHGTGGSDSRRNPWSGGSAFPYGHEVQVNHCTGASFKYHALNKLIGSKDDFACLVSSTRENFFLLKNFRSNILAVCQNQFPSCRKLKWTLMKPVAVGTRQINEVSCFR